MRRGECGQVTIFLSLLLISFLLVLSVCLEGIYVRIQMGTQMQQHVAAGEYVQANYQKELLERYHIFAVDGRYASKIETSIKQNWQENTGMEPTSLTISEQVGVTQKEGDILRHQIREYMKYAETAKILETLKKELLGVKEEAETDSLKNQVDRITEEQEEGKPAENGEEKQSDPRKGLKKLLSHGILSLVLPEEKEISEQTVVILYGKMDASRDKKIDFFKKDSIADYLSDHKKKTASSNLATEGLATAYAAEVFQNAVDHKAEDGIQYEMEYIVAGKDNDKENLKSAINRLMLIRFALNYAYLLSDSGRQAQAYALALQIGSIASAVPAVIEGIKMLLMAAWAYGESIIDLRSLLKGNKIPLVKNSGNWQLELSQLASLSAKEKQNQSGISYEDYLKILLLLQTDKKEKYMRMMDLMEQRIKISQPDFKLSECFFSYRMTVGSKVHSLFFNRTYSVENTRNYVY